MVPTRDATIKSLRAELDRMRKQAETASAKAPAKPKKAAKKAAKKAPAKKAAASSGSWRSGTTKLGTPGANHRDDLKVVNGIGPVLEKTLNGYGIQTWEQLAAFTKADIDKVDDALSFPGRIERDEWVSQAKALLKGHTPGENTSAKAAPKKSAKKAAKKAAKKVVAKKAPAKKATKKVVAKKAPAKKAAKKSAVRKDRSGRTLVSNWSKGKTKLGTAGAGHKDDLKVVNGIGPVLEKTLNGYGIQTWEQLAAFTKADIDKVDDALSFPGRIERDEWLAQAKDLIKRFPLTSPYHRPTRATYLNASSDDDPWS